MNIKNKKTVLIPGYSMGDNSFGVGKDYLELVSYLGAKARILMPTDELVEGDMLLLPGGADVAPSAYGEVPGYRTGNQDVYKDHFFQHRLKEYVDSGMGIVGICLGMQQLAVYFGSKLTQNFIYHPQSKTGWDGAHALWNATDYRKVGGKDFKVNSRHHQGVTLDDLSDDLDAIFLAENDDSHLTEHEYIVEAFMHKEKRILGIQWHPENFYDSLSLDLIKRVLQEGQNEQAGSK